MGITTKIITRPFMPTKRIVSETLPRVDGNVDITYYNDRAYYDEKVLEIQISIVKTDRVSLNRKISKIISWLNGGYDKMIFDDMPNIYWYAMPADLSSATIELGKVGKTTVQFRAYPFNSLVYDTAGIPLDTDIPLDSDIPIGYGDEYEFALVSGRNDFVLNYLGDAPVRPTINITGNFSAITILFGDKTFTYDGNFASLKIDCANFVCYSNDTDVTYATSGDFFEISNPETQITVTCTGSGTLQFVYNANFMYGDLSDD